MDVNSQSQRYLNPQVINTYKKPGNPLLQESINNYLFRHGKGYSITGVA